MTFRASAHFHASLRSAAISVLLSLSGCSDDAAPSGGASVPSAGAAAAGAASVPDDSARYLIELAGRSAVPEGQCSAVDVLVTSLGPDHPCQFTVAGDIVPDQACTGRVEVNGQRLICNGPDGWRLIDANTLELTGQACDTYKQTKRSVVQASFPCGAIWLH